MKELAFIQLGVSLLAAIIFAVGGNFAAFTYAITSAWWCVIYITAIKK